MEVEVAQAVGMMPWNIHLFWIDPLVERSPSTREVARSDDAKTKCRGEYRKKTNAFQGDYAHHPLLQQLKSLVQIVLANR